MPHFDFKRRRRGSEGAQRLGLVVGPVALIVWDNVKNVLIYDEVAERERAYREKGGHPIEFDDDDDDDDIDQ
jgi:hypothetical protein